MSKVRKYVIELNRESTIVIYGPPYTGKSTMKTELEKLDIKVGDTDDLALFVYDDLPKSVWRNFYNQYKGGVILTNRWNLPEINFGIIKNYNTRLDYLKKEADAFQIDDGLRRMAMVSMNELATIYSRTTFPWFLMLSELEMIDNHLSFNGMLIERTIDLFYL